MSNTASLLESVPEYSAKNDLYAIPLPQNISNLVEKFSTMVAEQRQSKKFYSRSGLMRRIMVMGYDASRDIAVVSMSVTYHKQNGYFFLNSKSTVYALIGVEDNLFFSYPLFSKPMIFDGNPTESIVKWAEQKIAGVTAYEIPSVIRHGGVAVVPVRTIPVEAEHMIFDEQQESGLPVLDTRNGYYLQADAILRRGDEVFTSGNVNVFLKDNKRKVLSYTGYNRIVCSQPNRFPWWLDESICD